GDAVDRSRVPRERRFEGRLILRNGDGAGRKESPREFWEVVLKHGSLYGASLHEQRAEESREIGILAQKRFQLRELQAHFAGGGGAIERRFEPLGDEINRFLIRV